MEDISVSSLDAGEPVQVVLRDSTVRLVVAVSSKGLDLTEPLDVDVASPALIDQLLVRVVGSDLPVVSHVGFGVEDLEPGVLDSRDHDCVLLTLRHALRGQTPNGHVAAIDKVVGGVLDALQGNLELSSGSGLRAELEDVW